MKKPTNEDEISRLWELDKENRLRERNEIEAEVKKRTDVFVRNIEIIAKRLKDNFPQSIYPEPIHYTKIACEIAKEVTFVEVQNHNQKDIN